MHGRSELVVDGTEAVWNVIVIGLAGEEVVIVFHGRKVWLMMWRDGDCHMLCWRHLRGWIWKLIEAGSVVKVLSYVWIWFSRRWKSCKVAIGCFKFRKFYLNRTRLNSRSISGILCSAACSCFPTNAVRFNIGIKCELLVIIQFQIFWWLLRNRVCCRIEWRFLRRWSSVYCLSKKLKRLNCFLREKKRTFAPFDVSACCTMWFTSEVLPWCFRKSM